MSDLRIQLENVDNKILLGGTTAYGTAAGRIVLNEHRTYGRDRFAQFEEDESLRVTPSGWTITRAANGSYAVANNSQSGNIEYAVLVLRLVMPGDPSRRGISLSAACPSANCSVWVHRYGAPTDAARTSSYWSRAHLYWPGLTATVTTPSDSTRWPDWRCRVVAWVWCGQGVTVSFSLAEAATPVSGIVPVEWVEVTSAVSLGVLPSAVSRVWCHYRTPAWSRYGYHLRSYTSEQTKCVRILYDQTSNGKCWFSAGTRASGSLGLALAPNTWVQAELDCSAHRVALSTGPSGTCSNPSASWSADPLKIAAGRWRRCYVEHSGGVADVIAVRHAGKGRLYDRAANALLPGEFASYGDDLYATND